MRPNFHDDPDARQKTEAFEVGMRVKVASPMVDFYAFRGETGMVIENSGRYLGIIVRFDEPRRFKDGGTQEQFNFNYYDLEPLPVEPDVPALQAEIADLRRQLAEVDYHSQYLRAVAQREALDRQLLAERVARKYAESEVADLRRQLAEAQRVNWQLEQDGQAAREERADLRRQLAEAQANHEHMTSTLKWELDAARQQLNEERFAVEALGGSLRRAEEERDTARKDLLHLQERLNAAIRSMKSGRKPTATD